MEVSEGLPHKYTLEELDDVKERLKETGEWLQTGIEEQKKLKKNDDPVLISAEMKARGVTLQNHVMKLLKKKTPKPPKKETKKEEKASANDDKPSEKPVEDVPKGDEQQKVIHEDL
jgi:hypoxia up-regulated 1